MAKFTSTANLLQSSITIKELNLNQYRQLLKCFIGDEIFAELIFNNTNQILEELTNLTEKQIYNLNFLDYLLLLLQIRQISIGDTIFLYLDDPEQKQLKIDLKIDSIIKQITNKNFTKLLQSEIIDSCEIKYRLPSINEILIFEKEKELYSIYTFFIKSIKILDKNINLENCSYKEREEIAQKLPLKVTTALIKRTQDIIELCNKINLFESLNNKIFDKTFNLTLNSQILAFILKLLFNTSLESIYEFMFALSKVANISSTFLDNCSPGEFYYFTKKLEEINAKQENQDQSLTPIETDDNGLPPITSEFNLE